MTQSHDKNPPRFDDLGAIPTGRPPFFGQSQQGQQVPPITPQPTGPAQQAQSHQMPQQQPQQPQYQAEPQQPVFPQQHQHQQFQQPQFQAQHQSAPNFFSEPPRHGGFVPPIPPHVKLKKKSKASLSTKAFAMGLMMLGALSMGLVLWFNLVERYDYEGDEGVPIIKAEDGPDRIVPEDRGGLQIPHRDKEIFSRMQNAKIKDGVPVVVANSEKPLVQKSDDKPSSLDIDEAIEPMQNQVASSDISVLANEIENETMQMPQLDQAKIQEDKPKNVKVMDRQENLLPRQVESIDNLPIKSGQARVRDPNEVQMEGQAQTQSQVKSQSQSQTQTQTQVQEQVAQVAPGPVSPAPKIVLEREQVLPKSETSPTVKAEAKMDKTKKPEGTVSSSASGDAIKAQLGAGFKIQLGSVREKEQASSEWARLKNQNPELKALDLFVSKVEIPEKGTFFRIQAGELSKESASSVCDALKKRSTPCIIVKP